MVTPAQLLSNFGIDRRPFVSLGSGHDATFLLLSVADESSTHQYLPHAVEHWSNRRRRVLFSYYSSFPATDLLHRWRWNTPLLGKNKHDTSTTVKIMFPSLTSPLCYLPLSLSFNDTHFHSIFSCNMSPIFFLRSRPLINHEDLQGATETHSQPVSLSSEGRRILFIFLQFETFRPHASSLLLSITHSEVD